MNDYCLQTHDVSYSYSSSEPIIQQVNLQVPTGSIYGFLGPNGAGKTTTLKLVLGLLKIQQGSVTILQQSLQKNRISILKQVGSLIESPSLYGHLTAFENLQLVQKIYQCSSKQIDTILQLVGLHQTANKKVHQFSLGMKQRLSIALALIHQPKLLILDEPTNGLDPTGIIEMRELLKKLNNAFGITIIISSHLLSEIEKLATHVGVINKGKLLFQGTLDQLQQKQQLTAYTTIGSNNETAALRIIRDMQIEVTTNTDGIVLPFIDKEIIGAINTQLVQNGIVVYQIQTIKNDLETIFINMLNSTK